MTKIIGIVGWATSETAFGVSKAYLEYFSRFGQVEILMPNDTVRDLDLLVLPGGPDVDPARYGEAPGFMTGKQCPYREYFDKVMLPKYVEKQIPIFAVCRGHQSLAIYFKAGKLVQHIDNGKDFGHPTNPKDDRRKLVHGVVIQNESFYIKEGYTFDEFKINSIHHQIVEHIKDDVAIISATADDLNTVEALEYVDYPAITVQWHPEEIHDAYSEAAIKQLLNI